jgi:hypothetical protein
VCRFQIIANHRSSIRCWWVARWPCILCDLFTAWRGTFDTGIWIGCCAVGEIAAWPRLLRWLAVCLGWYHIVKWCDVCCAFSGGRDRWIVFGSDWSICLQMHVRVNALQFRTVHRMMYALQLKQFIMLLLLCWQFSVGIICMLLANDLLTDLDYSLSTSRGVDPLGFSGSVPTHFLRWIVYNCIHDNYVKQWEQRIFTTV